LGTEKTAAYIAEFSKFLFFNQFSGSRYFFNPYCHFYGARWQSGGRMVMFVGSLCAVG
jgi:hypothetical protein